MVTHDERFLKNLLHLNKFVAFKQQFPSAKSKDKKEVFLARFKSRNAPPPKSLARWKLELIASVDLLDRRCKLDPSRKAIYSRGWKELFDKWANCASGSQFGALLDPVSGEPYIGNSRSIQEHVIKSFDVHLYFEPKDCFFGSERPGDMRDVLSYVVDESRLAEEPPGVLTTTPSHTLLSHIAGHTLAGTHFPSEVLPSSLVHQMNLLPNCLFPKGLLEQLRACSTKEELRNEISNSDPYFDTFSTTKMDGAARGN